MISEKELKTVPHVAYLAHPYNGKEANIADSTVIARILHSYYPKLTIVNPLTNLSYMKGEEESKILESCKELLFGCDLLILSDGWEHSAGCKEEFKAAQEANMDIMTIGKDEDGHLALVNFESEPPEKQDEEWPDIVNTASEKLRQDDDVKLLIIAAAGNEDKDGVALNNIVLKLTGKVREVVNGTTGMLGRIAYQVAMTLADDKEAKKVLKTMDFNVEKPENREVFAKFLLYAAASAVKDAAKCQKEAVHHAH